MVHGAGRKALRLKGQLVHARFDVREYVIALGIGDLRRDYVCVLLAKRNFHSGNARVRGVDDMADDCSQRGLRGAAPRERKKDSDCYNRQACGYTRPVAVLTACHNVNFLLFSLTGYDFVQTADTAAERTI